MRWIFRALISAHLMAAYIVGAQAQAPLQKIRVTIPVPVLPFYPLYVARDHGDFAKQGLDVEIITTSGDGPDVDALIAGSVQFTVSTPNRLFMAYEQGQTAARRRKSRKLDGDRVLDEQGYRRQTGYFGGDAARTASEGPQGSDELLELGPALLPTCCSLNTRSVSASNHKRISRSSASVGLQR